jgi:hypothetical protein
MAIVRAATAKNLRLRNMVIPLGVCFRFGRREGFLIGKNFCVDPGRCDVVILKSDGRKCEGCHPFHRLRDFPEA